MQRSLVVLGFVILALAVLTAAGTVAAQQITDPVAPAPVPIVPRACYIAQHDLNGDGRVNEVDMNQWKRWFLSEECQQGAGTCHEGMDIDGNGAIEFADLMVMLEHWKVCATAPRRTTDPGG